MWKHLEKYSWASKGQKNIWSVIKGWNGWPEKVKDGKDFRNNLNEIYEKNKKALLKETRYKWRERISETMEKIKWKMIVEDK